MNNYIHNHKISRISLYFIGLLLSAICSAHGGFGGGFHGGGFHGGGGFQSGGYHGGGFGGYHGGGYHHNNGFYGGYYGVGYPGVYANPYNCPLVKQCYSNGVCVQQQVCY